MPRKPAPNKAQKATKSTAKQRALIPQPHGGALASGGMPGNRGGTGRPPETIRADMRQKLDTLLPDVLEDYKAGKLDKVRVVEFLAKYGLGTKDEISVTDHPKFREAVSVIRSELEAEFGAERVDAAILRAQAKLSG